MYTRSNLLPFFFLLGFSSLSFAGFPSDIPEAADYEVVYDLSIGVTNDYRYEVPYRLDRSVSIPDGSFDRIAYFLELDGEWVWVSMDAFTTQANETGVPFISAQIRQQLVSNLNIYTRGGVGVSNGVGIATGNIEFWNTNYTAPINTNILATGSDTLLDFNDTRSIGGNYGSMQVHSPLAGETIFAFNRWNNAGASDLGIGSRPASDPDWTFAQNAGSYTKRRLKVLVRRLPLAPVPAHIAARVSEAAAYSLVYALPIDVTNNYTANVPYSLDQSALISKGGFGRVAYYLELDNEWVWVSMDAFESDASRVGVPNTAAMFWQQRVENMNVFASAGASVVSGTGIQTGNIEFWNRNYGSAPSGTVPGGATSYDFDDTVSSSGNYGSLQVHNYGANETLFAFNDWNRNITSDLGIGNAPGANPDWTFTDSAVNYTNRVLYVLVSEAPVAPVPVPVDVMERVPTSSRYEWVYDLPINNSMNMLNGVPYALDQSGLYRRGGFDRVAYLLELDDQWVWASFDPAQRDARLIGVPNTVAHIQRGAVSNLNLFSNAGLGTGTGITTANIEFWPFTYTPAPSGIVAGGGTVYDVDDTPTTASVYGSMQVHNYSSGETLFGFNRWMRADANDLGIGNGNTPGADPDWTFAVNDASYAVKRLRIFVQPVCTANLVANWSFDSDFSDATTNANHGVVVGGAMAGVLSNPSPLVNGVLVLDGLDDQVNTPPLVTTGSYTVAGWIWLATTNGTQSVYDADAGGDHFLRVVDGRLTAGQSGRMIVDPTGLSTGSWVHVAVGYDAVLNEFQLYRDGQAIACAEPEVNDALPSTAQDQLGGTNSFAGAMDDVAVWEGLVDADRIQRIYDHGLSGTALYQPVTAPTGLVASAVSFSTVELRWDPVPGADCYQVYRDGLFVASPRSAILLDAGLQAETNYTYTVLARSYRGDSVPSLPVMANTPEPPLMLTLDAFPTDLQLVPRNVVSNTGVVSIAGFLESPGWSSVVVRVERDGVSWIPDQVQPLVYSNNAAPFALQIGIPAETVPYDFSLWVDNGSTNQFVAAATNVVAGDVYMIQGQSNAEARSFNGSANGNRDRYVRSFGWSGDNPAAVTANTQWYRAEGDLNLNAGPGRVGQWPLRMGRMLRDQTGVPVAVVSGAHAGQAIGFFQRNDADPLDLGTNYGRLLWRMHQAGLADQVRGMLWYQGESDTGDVAMHSTLFLELHSDWLFDFPSLERFYVCQLREGCGVVRGDISIRDFQRRLPDLVPDFAAISTTGIDAHDGCHYSYLNGYEVLGDRIAATVLRDLYGLGGGVIDAPNPASAWFDDVFKTSLTIKMRDGSQNLVWDAGAEADFRVDGAAVTVTNGLASGDLLTLELSGSALTATNVSYIGHQGSGPWVTNSAGIGLFTFTEAVASFKDLDGDQLPDDWEVLYFNDTSVVNDPLVDSDGDGVNDGGEYIADTDPTDPLDVPALEIAPTGISGVQELLFDTSNERFYGIQFRASSPSGAWTTIATGMQGDGGMQSMLQTNLLEQSGYFRLEVALP